MDWPLILERNRERLLLALAPLSAPFQRGPGKN
jgi:hypothetical protein